MNDETKTLLEECLFVADATRDRLPLTGGDADMIRSIVEQVVAPRMAQARQEAIADFVNRQGTRSGHHSGDANTEDVAAAIGYYNVPVEMFYDDGLPLTNDLLLAEIYRQQLAAKAEGGQR